MSTPYYQPLDPAMAPDPVTPGAASAENAQGSYHATAVYGIQDPANTDAGMFDVAGSRQVSGGQEGTDTGAGMANIASPRQAATAHLLDSPMGFSAGGGTSGWDITPGYSGSTDDPGNGWPNNPQPNILETPDQGQGGYPESNTGTD